MVQTNPPQIIQNEQSRGAFEPPGLHGLRDGLTLQARHVHPYRKVDAVLVDERPECDFGHGVMVLEHGVQAHDLQPVGRKCLVNGLGLGNAVRHAARAQHLERMDHHHLATQAIERGRSSVARPVEPGLHRPLWQRMP